jgi:hypothetical protein
MNQRENISEIYWISPFEYVNETFDAYCWHFKIKNRKCTYDELSTFCYYLGLRTKQPTKKNIVDFLIDKKIAF